MNEAEKKPGGTESRNSTGITLIAVIALILLGGAALYAASSGSEDRIAAAKNAALAYYADKYGDSNVTAQAIDRGCHMEVNVLKDGTVIKRFSYSGGQRVYEIR